ncbi:MAG TPA: hypothetical protein VFY13_02055, partial [Luteolibacter sp.]|nr:hypothetical protein [Luteolibacter sp.]
TSVRVVHSVSYMDIKHQKNSYIGRWICDKIESDSKLANNGWLAADKWYLNYDKTQGPADAEATQ